MEQALWYLFVGTRGGSTRVAIVRAIDERPRNANQLAETIEMDYNTVTHHLDKLEEHDVVECGQEGYGALYFLTDQFEAHRETFQEILDAARGEE
ncbi:winged helix-turn-helix domain-containing protein [Salinarchaeum laminariae]|uniref:winged helix-turn-helix domain-containing protein n=1 Tax=Salinarchaeum laminariae TaxID=869888 RepID=UPI0020BDE47C|nr:winged helix-turn-helix domain-containing protein [Salinarchaeum laminariae]